VRLLRGVVVLSTLLTVTGFAQAPAAPSGSASISGRILTSSSQPIAGATVVLGLFADDPLKSEGWWATTTDENGTYQFVDLPAGGFTLIAANDGYVGWQSIPTSAPPPFGLRRVPAVVLANGVPRATVDLFPRGRASDVNLTLHRPSSVSGHAIRQDGSPAGESSVTLYMVDDAGAIISRRGRPTDAEGAYRFDDLPPGTYYLGPPQAPQDVDVRWLPAVTLTEGVSVGDIDVAIGPDIAYSITGRIVDASLQVPRILHVEYGVPGDNHRGLVTVFDSDGRFRVRDQRIKPGPLVFLAHARNDDGPLMAHVAVTTVEGPNEVEIVVGQPGGLRGRVSVEGGIPVGGAGTRLALVREGFTSLGAADEVIEAAPDGWLEADGLIGEYRVRVDEPQVWAVKAIRRRGLRLPGDRLVIRNAETLDDLEILIGPR
jgi:hypothetical protein